MRSIFFKKFGIGKLIKINLCLGLFLIIFYTFSFLLLEIWNFALLGKQYQDFIEFVCIPRGYYQWKPVNIIFRVEW